MASSCLWRWCCCFRRHHDKDDDDDEEETDVVLDYSHCGLLEVPDTIFLHERTLEFLFLQSNRIIELPWSIFNCQYLKVLNLRDNKIKVLPEAISFLINLEHLDIGHNDLKDIPPNLRECKRLKILDLSTNPVAALPDVVTQISSLEELYINDENFEFLTANIGRLRNLKVLELRGNRLTFLPSSCSKLVNLTKLDIGMNKIIESPLVFQDLKNLRELWYDANEVFRLNSIFNFSNLKILELEGNSLRSIPKEIGFCKNLVHLSVEENYIEALPNEISLLDNLQTLKLDDNNLLELPVTIGSLKNLEELYLSDNKLKRFPSSIGLLRKLVVLYADRNCLTFIPQEIGSCLNLRILSVQSNSLREVPAEIGNLINLVVLNLTNNHLNNLPISFFKLNQLKSLWLTYNQGKPLTDLQRVYDSKTHIYYASCYLLPQDCYNDKSEDTIPDSPVVKPRSECKISFDPESEERLGGLTRIPTPLPMKLRKIARKIQKSGIAVDVSSNCTSVVESVVRDHTPSSSSQVRTAVVRKQAVETDKSSQNDFIANSSFCEKNVRDALPIQHKLHSSTSSEESQSGNDNTIKESEPCFMSSKIDKSLESEYILASPYVTESEDGILSTVILRSNMPVIKSASILENSLQNISSTTCDSVIEFCSDNSSIRPLVVSRVDFPEEGFLSTISPSQVNNQERHIYCNVRESPWLFGKHVNALVIPIVLKKATSGIGFSLTGNERDEIIINRLESFVDSDPELKVGDKILQIDHIDISSSNGDTVESIRRFFDNYKSGTPISMTISRLDPDTFSKM